MGTGSQAVIPPSIHPDTRKPYVWERPLELEFAALMMIDGDSLALARLRETQVAANDDDDLIAMVNAEPLEDLTDAHIKQHLADLPDDWYDDRDRLIEVGHALNHQYSGSEKGMELWCEWAGRSSKYQRKYCTSRWKGLGTGNKNPVTMRSLIKAAKENRKSLAKPGWIVTEYDSSRSLN